jgi:RHS repeat-associated protein
LTQQETLFTITTDYIGNHIFEDNELKMTLFPGGFAQSGFNYYYNRDYLGHNRDVVRGGGTSPLQRTEYTPFGMQFPQTVGYSEAQQFKFGGKEFDPMHGLDYSDFHARFYDRWFISFTTPDRLAWKRPWESPYCAFGNNPVLNIDPFGMDYWSTNDPEQIKNFLNAAARGNSQFDFSSGWNHMTDADFADRLSYNDETGKYWISYGTVENGEVVINSKSFDADITPVSFSGEGYTGAFVYQPRSGFWGITQDFLAHIWDWTQYSTFDDGINVWNVNSSGRITGPGFHFNIGYPPAVGMRGGSLKGGRFTQKMGKPKGNMTGNQAVQNQQAKAIAKQLKLNKDQERYVHELIHDQG